MKKIITISCFCLTFLALFFILGTQSACQKQSTNCPCVITITDSNSIGVSGALVRLYAPHSTAGSFGLTNAAGVINFNFALPAIYNIAVTRGLGPNDTLKNLTTQVIQLEVGQTESTTVVVGR